MDAMELPRDLGGIGRRPGIANGFLISRRARVPMPKEPRWRRPVQIGT
jgi:hypothetical protein